MSHSGYTKEEVVRRGREIYERELREEVEPVHNGKFVAVDIKSGVWELGNDGLSASRRILAREPHAAVCLLKIGHPTAYRIGISILAGESH